MLGGDRGGVIRWCGEAEPEEDGDRRRPRGGSSLLPDLPGVTVVVDCRCCHCACDHRMALENKPEPVVVFSCCFEVGMMAEVSGGSEFASAGPGPVVGAAIPSQLFPALILDGDLVLVPFSLFFSSSVFGSAQLFTGRRPLVLEMSR